MPKAFGEDEKRKIAAQLLKQAHRLFSLHGLRKVTVEELASSVGISKGAFYLFYPSKEALFMDVVEEAELRFRQTVLATVDEPGDSPRARLYTVLRQAFTLWKRIPILQAFTRGEYEFLMRRVPTEQLQAHLHSDRAFTRDLIAKCQAAGIPVHIQPEQLAGLLHALFFTSMHEEDLGPGQLTQAMEILLELVAVYCLGEVTLQQVGTLASQAQATQDSHDEVSNHATPN